MNTSNYTMNDFLNIIKKLRSPEGCPWDKKQTHETLSQYAIEEAYELEDAISSGNSKEIQAELGDLLLQVILHAQIASEEDPASQSHFNIDDIVHNISQKMIERHPHVFSSHETQRNDAQNWEANKAKTKTSENFFDLPKHLPALATAQKIGKRTTALDFDWDTPEEVFEQLTSEMDELKEALDSKQLPHIEEELGDCLFTMAQLARKLKLDTEKTLRKTNKKIVHRIMAAFKLSNLSWGDFMPLPRSEKEKLWQKVKTQE